MVSIRKWDTSTNRLRVERSMTGLQDPEVFHTQQKAGCRSRGKTEEQAPQHSWL